MHVWTTNSKRLDEDVKAVASSLQTRPTIPAITANHQLWWCSLVVTLGNFAQLQKDSASAVAPAEHHDDTVHLLMD